MRRSLLGVVVAAVSIVTAPSAQVPGDRPAGNARGTRSVAVARNGMIATSQALASAAGLKALQDGGNAIDAAITAAGVLAVVEPTMNGIGGDLFAIVWDAKTKKRARARRERALRVSRPRPKSSRGAGLKQMPAAGPLAVDVPGVVEGWSQLLARFGTIPLAKALQPAIRYARDGFPVAGNHGRATGRRRRRRLAQDPRRRARRSCRNGRAAGDTARSSPTLGSRNSLELIAKNGRDAFYKGPIARAIVADMRARNGLLDERDFAEHTADWVETDLDQLPRLRRARNAAEHAGIRRARDAEHPRGLRHQGGWATTAPTTCTWSPKPRRSRLPIARRIWPTARRWPRTSMKTLLSKDYAAARRRRSICSTTGSYRAGTVRARRRRPATSITSASISATRST